MGEVSLPYRFTLLSNRMTDVVDSNGVSLPYRFTLLSNYSRYSYAKLASFITL